VLVGSTKFRLARRGPFGNENPRSITPLTTLNIVVTPAMPSARTTTARAQKPFSLIRTRKPILISRISVWASMGSLFRRRGRPNVHPAGLIDPLALKL